MRNRNPRPDTHRNIALTETERMYERLHLRSLTTEQIAAITGRAASTVRNALFKIREKRKDIENLLKVTGGSA